MSLECSFIADLGLRLGQVREQGLYRELRKIDSAQGVRIRSGDREYLNFSSNDYLGLATAPELIQAAAQALEKFGAGSGASRLICGSLAPHDRLEQALARFKGTESALAFSSGYATALGVITALLEKDDILVIDKLAHACIIDAARLCGCKLRIFAHNDLDELESILKWCDTRRHSATSPGAHPAPAGPRPRVLVVTESVFSMDGDWAPLPEIVALKQKYGAWLMLDEAHATGIIGAHGRGLAEQTGVAADVEIQMGTLGKALGSAGGYICGSRLLIDFLINRARSFIFSTAPPPASTAAAEAAVLLVQSPAGQARRASLQARLEQLKSGWPAGAWPRPSFQSPIVPVLIGEESAAVKVAHSLREQGIWIPAIRFPTVPRGKARLRLTVSAGHQESEVAALLDALKRANVSGDAVQADA